MKIGIIIHRIGGEDGVALETEKWIEVLKKMKHKIFLLSGKYEKRILKKEYEDKLESLNLESRGNSKEQNKFFIKKESCYHDFELLIRKTDKIAREIEKWINKRNLDLIIIENASALPINLSLTWAIAKVVKKTKIKTITHDHDFYWERGKRYISSDKKINKLVKSLIPLKLPNVVNVVINSKAKKDLKEKYQITNSFLIPNVMDFQTDVIKSKPKRFLDKMNIKKENIVLLQATRIVKRKGIETAIELLKELKDPNIKLLVTGNNKDGKKDEEDYLKSLKELTKKLGLQKQVIFAGDKFKSSMLFEAYNCADVCTYFSKYEGFGNAFVEAVLAKKPIFVNNYKPIFWEDIGKKGFKIVMIENNKLTSKAVKEMKKIIYDKKLQKEIAEYNFKVGKKYFSYEVLERKLNEIFKVLGKEKHQS